MSDRDSDRSQFSSTLRDTFFGKVSHVTVASLALGLCGAIPAGAAFAQGKDAEEPATLAPVTAEDTADEGYQPEAPASPKYTRPLVDIPQTITIIPAEVIQDRGGVSVSEVLRTVPGITLDAGEGGTPAGDRLLIRGFSASNDIFIDGVRDIAGYNRDPFNLEQLEVIKGPNSTYSGRGSTGGSVNMVTKAPQLTAFSGGTITVGSDETKRATVDVNQPLDIGLEGAAIRLNVMAHDQAVAGRDEVEKQRWGFAPSLALGLGTPTQITFSYYHQTEDNLPDYGHPFVNGEPADVDRDNFYGLVDRDFEDIEADIGTVSLTHDFEDGISLRNQLRYGRVTRDSVSSQPSFTGGLVPPQVTRSPKTRDSLDTILVNQTDLTFEFDTEGLQHTLVTGIELAREFSQNKARTNVNGPVTDLYNPDPGQSGTTLVHSGARTETDSDSAGVYAFDTIEITEQFELSGGLRWDYFNTDALSVATTGVGTYREHGDRVWSWRAGAVYKPLPYGSIYASYGTSFNPSAEALTLSDATMNLDPEENVSYEIGTKWDLFEEKLSLSLALFRTDKTNARVNTIDGTTILDGEQRVQGVELGLAGSITPEWKVFGGYTFMDSEILKSTTAAQVGKPFAEIPEHQFSIWTTYQVTPELDVGGGALYVDDRLASNSSATGDDPEIPSYWRFDAMAGYQITEEVGLQLNVQNLTDEVYYDGTHVAQHVLVAPGRTFLLTTSVKF